MSKWIRKAFKDFGEIEIILPPIKADLQKRDEEYVLEYKIEGKELDKVLMKKVEELTGEKIVSCHLWEGGLLATRFELEKKVSKE